jgi:NADH-quinone oxidoreductase subunit L
MGTATALLAASIGLFQNDIKKVLAYSTVSQLGYMFAALGLGAYSAAMFHVTTHAFFKALLFLGAGSVIHALGGEQDIRKMGGLERQHQDHLRHLPDRHACHLGPSVAQRFLQQGPDPRPRLPTFPGALRLLLLGALLTSFYMFRLFFLVFLEATEACTSA